MKNMDLSVIILSFNTKDITKRCLSRLQSSVVSCQKRSGNKIEVIVLDNASEDGSAQMIKDEFPFVKLLALEENTGFSKGNNLGMTKSKYPFILLLNSDVYLEEDSLYKALAYFKVNLNCDVLGAKLKYPSGKLQPSSGNLPNFLNTTFWIMGIPAFHAFHPTNHSYFSKAHQVGWVTGAFFMLKREVWENTLGFDENLFLYMEEVEWCKRILDHGFNIWYVPSIEVTHLHGASSQLNPQRLYTQELKGIKYYFKKYYAGNYFFLKIFLTLGLILRIIAFSLLGKTQRARAYVEGLGVI